MFFLQKKYCNYNTFVVYYYQLGILYLANEEADRTDKSNYKRIKKGLKKMIK